MMPLIVGDINAEDGYFECHLGL